MNEEYKNCERQINEIKAKEAQAEADRKLGEAVRKKIEQMQAILMSSPDAHLSDDECNLLNELYELQQEALRGEETRKR